MLSTKLQAVKKGNILMDARAISEFNLREESPNLLNEVVKSLGINLNDYTKFQRKSKNVIIGHKILSENKELNPLLKRWMWTNALFRNEYLNISFKGEYMHPAKKIDYRLNRKVNDDVYLDDLVHEASERLKVMAKRNVVFTSTFELPARNKKEGVPNNLNIAVINDYTGRLQNLSMDGSRDTDFDHEQDLHDGSSIINYAFAKMIEASYPGKGYTGTKKQFGTFV